MSSYRPTATRVLRLRVKDKHAAWLSGLAREVNTVFNYCNELSVKVFERERRFLSGFDFWPFLKGVTRGDCALHLPVQAVQEIAEEYARRRRQHRKVRLGRRGWDPGPVARLLAEAHTGILDQCARDVGPPVMVDTDCPYLVARTASASVAAIGSQRVIAPLVGPRALGALCIDVHHAGKNISTE